MVPDLIFVKQSFAHFNTLIFGSELPEPKFALTKARSFRGKLVYRCKNVFGRKKCFDFEMRISVLFNLEKEEWEDVVIHEMIHYYIAFKHLNDASSHGPLFRKIMNHINDRHQRNITVSTKSTDAQRADNHVRGHYLCLAKFNDGRLGVAPVAKTRLFDLWNALGRIDGVVATKWVGAIDPWFNRFPRVMKPKLYISTVEEVLPHLKGAVTLERDGFVIKAVSRRCSPDELLP